jgi:uncharacterized protein YecE (DUF72 family)
MASGTLHAGLVRGADAGGDAVRIGLPLWAFPGWTGNVYSADARSGDYLRQYARAFSAVEGNSTFYSVPDARTLRRWRDESPDGFRICFKLPRRLTHDLLLAGVAEEACAFVRHMAALGPRLGPFMIQLGRELGPEHLGRLEELLRALPREHRYAVEVRHRTFYREAACAERLRALLKHHGCDRVVLDTSGLRAGPADHPDVRAARHPKPDLPVDSVATSDRPIVRFIGHPLLASNDGAIADWGERLAAWLAEGRRPYVFFHCPNDVHAPTLARRAHAALAPRLGLPPLPAWPGEMRETAQGQLALL